MTHFNNNITQDQLKALLSLSHECGKVLFTIGKILKNGYDDTTGSNYHTLREKLEHDLGGLKAVTEILTDSGDLSKVNILTFKQEKLGKLKHR